MALYLLTLLFLRNKMNGDLNQDRLDGLEVLVIIDDREMLKIRSYKGFGVFLGRNGIFNSYYLPALLLRSGMLCSAVTAEFVSLYYFQCKEEMFHVG